MPSPFKLLKSQRVLKGRIFDICDETWRGPENSTFKRLTLVHPGAVAILPIDTDGNILLIRQFRPAARGWLLEIPAGTLEKGEKPLACAKRELIEETGFAAKHWRKLGIIHNAPGYATEIIHLYQAWDLTPAHAEQDEDEHIELARMTPAAVQKAVRSNRISDAKTLSALLMNGL